MSNNKILDIGSRLEPFFDDWLISKADGIKLQLHHPIPREIVLEFDSPWEGSSSSFASVFRDKDVCRMYYRRAAEHLQKNSSKTDQRRFKTSVTPKAPMAFTGPVQT